jgi:hypothetical protein
MEVPMGATEIGATVCYVLSLLMVTGFGVTYLTRSKFMPCTSSKHLGQMCAVTKRVFSPLS